MYRQVGFLGEILAQQAVGIFICAALPRALRVAEVDVDFCCQSNLFVLREPLSQRALEDQL